MVVSEIGHAEDSLGRSDHEFNFQPSRRHGTDQFTNYQDVTEPVLKPRSNLRLEEVRKVGAKLSEANQAFARRYPGESDRRQAVHTVYGGAHLFKADSAQRLGAAAL